MSVLNGPSDGTWSVFASKVVRERDDARFDAASLKDRLALAQSARDEAVALLRDICDAQAQVCIGCDYPASEAKPCGECLWCRVRKIIALTVFRSEQP